MSNAIQTPVPPTRDPVSHGRAFVEGAVILTPLGTILAWLITLLPVEVPETVQQAMVGLVVTIGSLVFSEWRNQRYNRQLLTPTTAIILLALSVCLACATFGGTSYKATAGSEIVALRGLTDLEPLDPARCAAHKAAAKALRDPEGDSHSLKAPFFAGQHVAELADRHDRLGSICYELVDRERARGVLPEHRAAVRADWIRAWSNGRALLGGPEEE